MLLNGAFNEILWYLAMNMFGLQIPSSYSINIQNWALFQTWIFFLIVITCTPCKNLKIITFSLNYHKSTIKPPPSLVSPLFRRRKFISPPLFLACMRVSIKGVRVPRSATRIPYKKSVYTQGVAHMARTYSGFCSMKQLEIFLLPLDVMPVCHRVSPINKFASEN